MCVGYFSPVHTSPTFVATPFSRILGSEAWHDPQICLDWIVQLDKYFSWYNLTEPRKIKFVVVKLTGQASQYWTNLENIRAFWLQRSIKTWDMMKDELKGKYVPPSFSDRLMDKWHQYNQGNKSARSTLQNSMSFSLDAVPSVRKDKLKSFLDSEPNLEKTCKPNC